jgi:hypothetical protein
VDFLLEEQRKTIEEGKEVIFTDERIISNILEKVASGKFYFNFTYRDYLKLIIIRVCVPSEKAPFF